MINSIKFWDQKILLWLNQYFAAHWGFLNKFFAEYLIYSLPLTLIYLWFYSEKAKKVALKGLFSVILGWPIIANIIGHLINRSRPFETEGIKELIFHRPTYSFPSDHATAIFALAFSFWLSGYKKLAVAIFIIGLVISFFRVTTAIHYPSDILGGIVVGFVAAYLIDLFDKPLDMVYKFIIRMAKIVRLA